MDARRLELYELLKPKLDSEPARQLVLALGPAPDEVSAQIRASEERLSAKIDTVAARLEAVFTRRMVTILGAWTILVGSTVGWIFTLAQ